MATATATATTTATATNTPGPCAGIYPIGIDAAVLSGDDFVITGLSPPEGVAIMTGRYAGHTQRRLYMGDTVFGDFIYLRWHIEMAPGGVNAMSTQALIDSMTDGGNYGAGLEEAPWPADYPAPEAYPEQPGVLNMGDWVYETTGWKNSVNFDAQITVERPMVLPIYDARVGISTFGRVRVARLGHFVLTGYGRDPGKGPYLDFISLGDPAGLTKCAGAIQQSAEVWGQTSFYPEYALLTDNTCTPGADGTYRSTIPSDQFVNGTPGVPFTYPQVGEVLITNANTADSLTAPILASTDGELSYGMPSLSPGIYTIRAYLYYHHPLDQPNLMRQYGKLWAGEQVVASVTLELAPTVPGATIRYDLQLRLSGDICAAP
jgi:hypothetical protein